MPERCKLSCLVMSSLSWTTSQQWEVSCAASWELHECPTQNRGAQPGTASLSHRLSETPYQANGSVSFLFLVCIGGVLPISPCWTGVNQGRI